MSGHVQRKQSYQLRLGLGPSKVDIYNFFLKKKKQHVQGSMYKVKKVKIVKEERVIQFSYHILSFPVHSI